MNYETLSDFELNKRLNKILHPMSDGTLVPDYCHSLADTGPVIYDLKIDMCTNDICSAHGGEVSENGIYEISAFSTNPLHAAVIVAIQVLEKVK